MSTEEPTTKVYDLRVVVERIEGRSVCGMKVGDHIDLTESSRLSLPEGQHFCMYALAACLPLLPAKQRALAEGTGWPRTAMWPARTPRSGSSCASNAPTCGRSPPRS